MQGQKEQKVIKKITQNNLKNQAQMLPQEKQKKKHKRKKQKQKLHLIAPGLSLTALTRAWMFHNRGTQLFVSGNICSEGLKSPEIVEFSCSES